MRPTIYIGLGGTGIRAIAQTKKMYEDAYGVGQIPVQIAFMAVDFDLAAPKDKSLATDIEDDFLHLNTNANPKQFYEEGVKVNDYKWMFKGNGNYIKKQIAEGASQVRTTGRFYTELVLDKIRQRVKQCWSQVNAVAAASQKVDKTAAVDIHLVMSLAGGTGCGSFLNVAEMIRSTWPTQAHIVGYGVLHGVFCAMDPSRNKTPRVVANAYSAIVDLDYLMSASSSNPIHCTINGKEQQLTGSVYDEFFVIDNETELGHSLTDIKQVCEVLGISLFASGDDMGSKVRSVLNNKSWTDGEFNVSPKIGWSQALGACKVVYKGEQLAEIYGYKAAVELLRTMRNEGADAQQIAQKWTEEVEIREDGEQYNMLIDGIISPEQISKQKEPKVDIKSSDADNQSAIANYINNCVDISDANAVAMENDKKAKLEEKVNSLLRSENGVGNTLVFLKSLKTLCEKYRGEMIAEAEEFRKSVANKTSILDKCQRDYTDYCKKLIFKTDSGKQERLDDVSRCAKDILKLNYQIKRRDIARNIFIQLAALADSLLQKVEALKDSLDALSMAYSNDLAQLQNTSESTLVFEYDLSAKDRHDMVLKNDVVFVDFIKMLPESISLLDAKNISDELRPVIDSYVKNLPEAVQYREKKITDVIEELSDEAYSKLKFEITVKASRLLKIDDRGLIERTKKKLPSEMMVQNYFISVYDADDMGEARPKTRLERDNAFAMSENLKKEFLVTNLDMLRQQMIIFRADCAIIPYCIDSFDPWTIKDEYESLVLDASQAGSTTFNPHFDQEMFDDMRSTDFKLKPEILNEAMLYWVCGHLFGWEEVTETAYIMEKDKNGHALKIASKEDVVAKKYIRFMNKAYYIYKESEQSQGKNGKWFPIGGVQASGRKRAFENFKAVDFPKMRNELLQKVTADIKAVGLSQVLAMVDTIKSAGETAGKYDYIDRIACTDKNSATYFAQNSQDIAQFDAEWNYIYKDLAGALSNLVE